MLETFTKWFYLIGPIVSAISILTYFLYKAGAVHIREKLRNQSIKF